MEQKLFFASVRRAGRDKIDKIASRRHSRKSPPVIVDTLKAGTTRNARTRLRSWIKSSNYYKPVTEIRAGICADHFGKSSLCRERKLPAVSHSLLIHESHEINHHEESFDRQRRPAFVFRYKSYISFV
jgi:hypothetical protein